MTKNNSRILTICLYLNYFVHGIGLVVLAQNMDNFASYWRVSLAEVSYVISGVGWGRLCGYFFFSYLADKVDRKKIIYSGMLAYFVFFFALPFSLNIYLAYFLAMLAGLANSALDLGTYPTFMELGDKQAANNVLIKAFMSLGEFFLPILVLLLADYHGWYGWAFILPAGILSLNLTFFSQQVFQKGKSTQLPVKKDYDRLTNNKKYRLTFCLAIYGYLCQAVMLLFTQWISLFAHRELAYSSAMSHALLSFYSLGSISGVLVVFSLLSRKIAEIKILLLTNFLSLISLLIILNTRLIWLSAMATFIFGFTAAGGAMQVALNLFLKLYPDHKSLVTGSYFIFGSVASITIPVLTGLISQSSLTAVLDVDVVISLLASLTVCWAYYLLKPVFYKKISV